jgi:hypothetical protein
MSSHGMIAESWWCAPQARHASAARGDAIGGQSASTKTRDE